MTTASIRPHHGCPLKRLQFTCLLVLVLVVGSCHPPGDSAFRGGVPRGATSLTIKGSDTMVYLLMLWAEAFMRSHPEADISVTGGGSGTGFAALINGTTDLCAASRTIRDQERELALARGKEPMQFVVAQDGLAVVVHPSNNIPPLSIEQLRRIYTGVHGNWRDVGGEDRPILVLSRDTSSGTYVFFEEHVLLKQNLRRDTRLLPASSAIVQAVSKDVGAIGYVGLGYAKDAGDAVRVLPIRRSEQSQAVTPSREDVITGDYAIARPLYLYTPGPPSGLTERFIEFCLSAEGQAIVQRTGYVAVQETDG